MFELRSVRAAFAMALAAGFCICNGALSQTLPNIGQALRQVQPPVHPAPPATRLPQLGGNVIEAAAQTPPDEATLDVSAFDIQGNPSIDASTLRPLLADGEGRALTMTQLQALAHRITAYYQSRGYFLARAYIPAQIVENGVVRIAIVEGHYGEFKLHNTSRVRDETVQAILDQAKPGIVSQNALERALLIVNDTPGAQVADVNVMAGEQEGTSDFAVDARATAPYSGYALLDNYGSAYTGKNRLSLGIDFNSPTRRGDRLSLSALGSDNGGILNGRAAYSTLLMPNGLRSEISLGRTQYLLGGVYQSLNATGTANALDIALSYPMVRTRTQTLDASLNWAHKTMEDHIRATETFTPKSAHVATAAFNLRDERRLLGFDGMTQAGLALSWGTLRINEASASALDAAEARTAGSFGKLALSASRMSLLPADFTMTTGLRIQQALLHKNLDSSERMSVSGNGAVMAYPTGELTGSHATLIHLELSRPLPAWFEGLQHHWQMVGHWGQAAAARPISAGDARRSLRGMGIGWAGQYRGVVFKVQAAHRLAGDPVSEPYPRTKVLAQVGQLF